MFVQTPFADVAGQVEHSLARGALRIGADDRGLFEFALSSVVPSLIDVGVARNAGKDAMVAAARARGFEPPDDNEADALALLACAIAQGDMA